MRALASLALLLWTACAASPANDVPTIEPLVLPEPGEAQLAFTAEPGVTALELGCHTQPRADGTDSDCDGHLNGGMGGDAALELSLTWRAPATLELVVEPALEGDVDSRCSAEGLCRLYLRSDALPATPLALSLARTDDQDDASWASLCISAKGRFLGCHNVDVSPGQERAVGQISIP